MPVIPRSFSPGSDAPGPELQPEQRRSLLRSAESSPNSNSNSPSKRELPALRLKSDSILPNVPLSGLPLITPESPSSSESKRDLPPLSVSSDTLLAPLDILDPKEPETISKRDLPPLSLSSDALLKPLDLLDPPKEPSSNSKRDLPSIGLSSDALLKPLDALPLLGDEEESTASSRREAAPLLRLDSDKVLGAIPVEDIPLLSSEDEESPEFKRDLPSIGLSTDALLAPVEDLPLLSHEDPSSKTSKRDAAPLLRVDPDRILKALPVDTLPVLDPEEDSQATKRSSDPPLVRVGTSNLFKSLPIENLQLNPLQSSSSKRAESDKSVPELPSDSGPPLVHVGAVEVIQRLGKVNLLKPTDVLKRADDADGSKAPPFVSVNSLQFLDKLGKVDLLNPLDSLKRSEDHPLSRRDLHARQNSVAIPTQYAGINSGPAPGAVAGIVLGSVAGFLLIVWLLWLISNGGGVLRSSRYTEDDVVISRHRSRSPGTRRSHRSRRTEMTSRSPRRERVIRQERIVRDRSAPPPRETSRLRETVIMDERPERRVDGDDIVEVIEEHSSVGVPPPRRSKGRRSSGYR